MFPDAPHLPKRCGNYAPGVHRRHAESLPHSLVQSLPTSLPVWLVATGLTAAILMLAACGGGAGTESGPPRVEGDAIGVAGAHEHGVVRFGLAVDGLQVTLAADAPAQALFGFERMPQTDEERALVAERLERLATDGGSMVSFEPSTGCGVDEVTVTAPAGLTEAVEADGRDHDEADHPDADHDHQASAHEREEDHLEVGIWVQWSCLASPEGSAATLDLARAIPDAELVDLTVITSQGSDAARVSADAAFYF